MFNSPHNSTRRSSVPEESLQIGEPLNVRKGFHVTGDSPTNSEIRRQVEEHEAKEKSSLKNSKQHGGVKALEALLPKKKKGGPSEGTVFISSLSGPQNFQHLASVDFEFNWHGNPLEVLQIGRKLGEGAYGSVFMAQYKSTDFVAAVKMIPFVSSDGREVVQKEIVVLRKSVYTILYFGWVTEFESLQINRILMEYCEVGALSELLDTLSKTGAGKLKEFQLAALLWQTVRGLAFLHKDDIKVIHRDLKSGNILLTSTGGIKIADFGISFQQTSSRSKAATLVGTPLFMSPEILDGQRYSNSTDIWSLGITAIEMADGSPPYAHDHPMRALYRLASEAPPTVLEPSAWSNEFNSFLTTCLQKDPSLRPPAIMLLEHPFLKNMNQTESINTVKDLVDRFVKIKEQERAKRDKEKEEFAAAAGVPGVKGKSPALDLRFTTLSEADHHDTATPFQQWKQDKEKKKKEEKEKEEADKGGKKEQGMPAPAPVKKPFTFDTLSDTLDEDAVDNFREAIAQEAKKDPSRTQQLKTVSPEGSSLMTALEKEQEKQLQQQHLEEKREKELDRTSSVYLWQNYTKGAEKLLAQSHDNSAAGAGNESPSATDDESETLTESESDGSDIITDWHDSFRYRATGKGTTVVLMRSHTNSESGDNSDENSGTRIFYNTMSAGAQKIATSSDESLDTSTGKPRSVIEKLRDGNSLNTIPALLQKSRSKPEMPVHKDPPVSPPTHTKSKKHSKKDSKKNDQRKSSASALMEIEGIERYLGMSMIELIYEIESLRNRCNELEAAAKKESTHRKHNNRDSKS